MEKVSRKILSESIENDLDFEFGDQVSSAERLPIDSAPTPERVRLELPEGIRLDVGVTDVLGKSRSFIQGLIAGECVKVNGFIKKANYKVRQGDMIEVMIPAPREAAAEPENIPLEILYEDEDVLVVNKPQGMVVHPAPGAWTGTMVNALLYHCKNLSGINGVLRPGIVHRIDKDTSGILVVAKNDSAHQGLAAQLKAHTMERKYLTLVQGVMSEPSGTVSAPIGRDPSDRKRMAVVMLHSKPAVTYYTVLERFKETTYLEVRLETGRTHQIRVHMAYIKHPVIGDPVYGSKKNQFGLPGQMLHAAHLGFEHPVKGIWMRFDAPVPKIFAEVIEKLRSN
ncbi:RluA family pseudouridine synthase [Desulfosporosinus youngiae]|uniref:Pseudouridine synthase n=1 Tax=Desulfosporosinus youngiae DSM 17734 TaxID=768710 RepID=H5XY10_9FIRM|nr:pseudouridine synthase, RluA family [Desulfosporosinus youngiae DSM 17734]